jgi:hypothetical protein
MASLVGCGIILAIERGKSIVSWGQPGLQSPISKELFLCEVLFSRDGKRQGDASYEDLRRDNFI